MFPINSASDRQLFQSMWWGCVICMVITDDCRKSFLLSRMMYTPHPIPAHTLPQNFRTPLLVCKFRFNHFLHSTKKPVTTMLTYPWKCTVLHCNHLGNTWKPLVLMTRHFDYCPSASKGDNQSVRSSAPVVSRCFPGGYNVKLYISRGRLA